VLAPLGAISIHGSQRDTRNIEQSFTPGHRNINCMQDEKIKDCYDKNASNSEATIASKPADESKHENKRVLLEPSVPLSCTDRNNDVLAWQTSNLIGVSRSTKAHRRQINPSAKPRK
jgi:hypothetical protein